MRKSYMLMAGLFCFLFFSFIQARPWRPGQIPNGTKFSCANCHVDPAGGGPRNKFGQAVEQLVTAGGTQEFWGPALAQMDSDDDGKTNGQELGDPTGAWRSGQPNPGSFNAVTNPGVANSTADVEITSALPIEYKLYNNYPNPFNPSTKIKFDLPENAFTIFTVYDLLGNKITELVNGELTAGSHEIEFKAEGLASGIYLYKIQANNFTTIKKMVMTK